MNRGPRSVRRGAPLQSRLASMVSLALDFGQTGSMVDRRSGVVPYFTRATTATVPGFEKLDYAISGEARMGGMRRVYNLAHQDLSSAAYTALSNGTGSAPVVTSGQAAPDGTTTAYRVQLNRGAGDTAADYSILRSGATVGSPIRSVWLKSNTGASQTVGLAGAGAASSLVTVTTEWQRLATPTVDASSVSNFDLCNFGPNGTTRSVDILAWHPQLETVTGQSNQNPSEYVSVGAAKRNYLTYTEQLDNAAWAATSVTKTADAGIAPDGALTAELLTASAGNGTVIQDLGTLASAAWVGSIYLKRMTGSGNVQLTLDNGSTWTTVAVTTTWTRFEITQTLANPDFGVRIATNTDAVLAWGGQVEQGSAASTYFKVENVYPYHGAMVDGVAYFPTTNGNTVASNVVTEATGTAISSSTRKGLLIEEARTNLATYSQDISSWSITGATHSSNSAIAPDGTTTADSYLEHVVGYANYIVQAKIFADSTTYTYSHYMKRLSGRDFGAFAAQDKAGNIVRAWFDLATGVVGSTVGTGVTNKIESVGNGWYRCSMTFPSSTGGESPAIYASAAASDGALLADGIEGYGLYFWGAQCEAGSEPTTYIPTTTAAVTRNADVAAITSLGGWFARPRTNLILQSQTFTTAPWTATSGSNTQDTVAPDGTTTAWTMPGFGAQTVYQAVTLTANVYTASVYIKKTTGYTGFPIVSFELSPNAAIYTFDTNNGVATAWTSRSGGWSIIPSTSLVEDAGDYWRLSIAIMGTAAAYKFGWWSNQAIDPVYAGPAPVSAGTPDTQVFWGAQIERGDQASDYIATTSAAVTEWEGSIVSETEIPSSNPAQAQAIAQFDDGTANNRYLHYRYFSSADYAHAVVVGGVVTALDWTAGSAGAMEGGASAFKKNDLAVSGLGGAVVADTSSAMPPGITTLRFGKSTVDYEYLNGYIKRLNYYPRRLPNTVLPRLST